MIDIRPASEYQQKSLAASRNVPYESINFPKLETLMATSMSSVNESDPTALLAYLLVQPANRKLAKVIIGNNNNNNDDPHSQQAVVELANYLVRKHKLARVCILHNGVESLRDTRFFQQSI